MGNLETTGELYLREMLDALPVAFYITDTEGRLIYFNRAAVSLAGRVPEIGIDKWCVTWKLLTADGATIPRDQCLMATMLMDKPAQLDQEHLAERPDGSRFWFTPYPTILRDANGRITGGANMLVDITERKPAQSPREINLAERPDLLLKAIVDSSDDAIISKNLNGVITSWNKSAERIFGFTAAEAIGQPVASLLIPADRQDEEPSILARLRRGERIDHFETKRKRKDGALLDISLTISPVRDTDGAVIGASKIARDLTGKKQTERSALLLSAIVDSSDDAILSKDLNGVITSWNKSAERIFGYTAEEAIGQPVAKLLIPADRQDEEPAILGRLRRGERVDHFETKRKHKDGTILDISLTISPVKDSSGTIIGASKVARDITAQIRGQQELRLANEALTRSNADLEQFAYSASHDLQEPLRMVSAYSEMLRRKFGSQLGDSGEEYIRFIIDGAARMEQLLRDLRAYTYAATTNEGPAPVVNPEVAFQRSIATLKAAIDESGAEIACEPLPPVRIHQVQLEQLFQNIIGNAIRYRSNGRVEIRVGAQPDGDAWRFFIQDNGIGIDPAYKEQIFGIFKRLHTSSEYPGTGMGLAICQRIVERSGGRIWVESQRGRGSTFFFTLPAAPWG